MALTCGTDVKVYRLGYRNNRFIFDAGGKQRYRTAGVPKAADLRTALDPLV